MPDDDDDADNAKRLLKGSSSSIATGAPKTLSRAWAHASALTEGSIDIAFSKRSARAFVQPGLLS